MSEAPGGAPQGPPDPGGTTRISSRLRIVLTGWRAPQHRDGLALVLSSALSSVVGLLYWVVAARLFAPEIVGVNNTLISTMTLIAVAAQLNLGNALLRFVPVAGRSGRRLVAACYAVGGAAAGAAGAVFALGAGWWAPELLDAVGLGPLLAFFVVSTPVWTLFVMQDYVLTAIKRATLVPVENLVFALLKIVLLGVGAALAFTGAIAVSWVVTTALIVLVISGFLMRALPDRGSGLADHPPSTIGVRTIARFASADWLGGLFTLAVEFGLPLLVLVSLGAESAATFGVVWAIAYGLYLVSHGMGQSMVAHVAGDPDALAAARRGMTTKSLALLLPAVLVIVPGAGLILTVFGSHYVSTGTALLALSSLSAVPNVVVTATLFSARVQQRRGVLLGVPLVTALLVIPTALVLMPMLGLTGVGIALLAGQTLTAAAILARQWFTARRARSFEAV
jgi:O-antigen/teichoic acid export membrane protein